MFFIYSNGLGKTMKFNLKKLFFAQKKQNSHLKIDQITTAMNARKNLETDFFGSWDEESIDLLKEYQYDDTVDANNSELLDWLGIVTPIRFFPGLQNPNIGPLSKLDIPIPDDGIHAHTIEYLALIISLKRAHSNKTIDNSFTMMELGASFGPWATTSGVLAIRKGFDTINLVAVEANRDAMSKITQHAKRNGLLENPKIKFTPVHGAVYLHDNGVFFPKIDSIDNGAQISIGNASVDYRGRAIKNELIPSFTLKTLCTEYKRVDFLHLDIQGSEETLLQDDSFLATLNDRVVTLFIGTHSRLIEGIALQKLSAMGWLLYKERPTRYAQRDGVDINAWTLQDGGQIWFNQALLPA